LFRGRTVRANCRKQSPSLIGFCVYILESGAAQSRRRLLLKRLGDAGELAAAIDAKFFGPDSSDAIRRVEQ